LVILYALAVLWYVQSVPDLGLKSAFSPVVKQVSREVVVDLPGEQPRQGDRVVRVGDRTIATWPDLLLAPLQIKAELADLDPADFPSWAKPARAGQDGVLVLVRFERAGAEGEQPQSFTSWCSLAPLTLSEMAPSILWFFLKLMLFGVGALVLWKRPRDAAAAQFFLMCVVTLGAYMGGYHWPHITTAPVLLIGFIVCGVLLPVVSLHFYLVFPRPKQILQRYPRRTLLAVYGVPLLVLATLLVLYLSVRWRFQHQAPTDQLDDAVTLLLEAIYVSLGVSAAWYLASVCALVHGYWTVADTTTRNQVKWILGGTVLSLLPIGYSLYLAIWEPDQFGAGAATWPMFAASVVVTTAFIVSITRYRLMELDQIVSAGVVYFFLAGLVYYALVFLGTLVFNQVIAGPRLSEALRVCTSALVLLLVLDLARSRLRKALDRRFSREKYHLDRTLQRMGEAVQQLVDPPTLVQRLLHASADLLGVASGSVYLCQDPQPAYRLAGTIGAGSPPQELADSSPLLQALRTGAVVTALPVAGVPLSSAQQQLKGLGGEVAQPLTHEGRLLALVILGPKDRSAYRQPDLNLLAAFAQITAQALASAAGHQTIDLLNRDLQGKVEKIAEQQRRIFALQSQLRRVTGASWRVAAKAQAAPASLGDRPASAAQSLTTTRQPLPANASGIVGSSRLIRQVLEMARKVAATDAVVLIRGESGTGKELLAQAVHDSSSRAGKAFVKVHCAALSPTLLESELFGHVKGAFTGAISNKTGRFELANGGTLFLDEIGDVTLEVQTKLLRVLQDKTIERVGSSESVKVDVRILAATHQDLEDLIRQGRFREDLYYRLNVFPMVMPPLRERAEDIPELALFFLQQCARRCKKEAPQLDDDALVVLKAFSWPGNVRQLENVIERAVVIAEGSAISVRELPGEVTRAVAGLPGVADWHDQADGVLVVGPLSLGREERERRERELIVRALEEAGGNKAEAARALGLARSTLVSRLKKYGMA
jgi:transcriptional regulator with GAF, ATPase, and Fis domain